MESFCTALHTIVAAYTNKQTLARELDNYIEKHKLDLLEEKLVNSLIITQSDRKAYLDFLASKTLKHQNETS